MKKNQVITYEWYKKMEKKIPIVCTNHTRYSKPFGSAVFRKPLFKQSAESIVSQSHYKSSSSITAPMYRELHKTQVFATTFERPPQQVDNQSTSSVLQPTNDSSGNFCYLQSEGILRISGEVTVTVVGGTRGNVGEMCIQRILFIFKRYGNSYTCVEATSGDYSHGVYTIYSDTNIGQCKITPLYQYDHKSEKYGKDDKGGIYLKVHTTNPNQICSWVGDITYDFQEIKFNISVGGRAVFQDDEDIHLNGLNERLLWN